MVEFAKEEIAALQQQLVELEKQLKLKLLPKDPLDDKNIMLEIRAGGGAGPAGQGLGQAGRCWCASQVCRQSVSAGWLCCCVAPQMVHEVVRHGAAQQHTLVIYSLTAW